MTELKQPDLDELLAASLRLDDDAAYAQELQETFDRVTQKESTLPESDNGNADDTPRRSCPHPLLSVFTRAYQGFVSWGE